MADDPLIPNEAPDRTSASGGLNFAPNDPAKQAATGSDTTGFVASAEPTSPSFEEASAARTARAGGTGTFTGDSAARQERAGGASTFEGESARRQLEAGGAATFAQESIARNERALPSRSFGQSGPDSRDRDRTGRISNDEQRALDRVSAGTSKSSFDAGKIQAILSRIGRSIGGQKEIDRQLDSAFGSGAAQLGSRSEPEAAPDTSGTEDLTGALHDDDDPNALDPNSSFNRSPIVGLPNFSI